MNNQLINKTLATLMLGFSALAVSVPAYAGSTEVCSKEVLLAYFPENFVLETLKSFKVPEDQWQGIIKDLNTKEKEVVKLVEEKAAKIQPNPLKEKTPESRNATVKIFRETILDIFSGVMNDHGIKDEKQIQQMLVEIQQQKARNFAKCMEKQRDLFNKEQNSPSESNKSESTENETSEEKPSSQSKFFFVADKDEETSNIPTEKPLENNDSDESKEEKANKDNSDHETTNNEDESSDREYNDKY